jgi:hypothetical protein
VRSFVLVLLPLPSVPHLPCAICDTLPNLFHPPPQRLRAEVAINYAAPSFFCHRCEGRPPRFLPASRSQKAASLESSNTVRHREGTQRETETQPPVRLPTLAPSPSVSPFLCSIQFIITTKPQFHGTRSRREDNKRRRRRKRRKEKKGVSYQNHSAKKRSPCCRDALFSPPPRFEAISQLRAPTACNRNSPRFWIHWPLNFLPRLEGAGPALGFSQNHLSLEPTANLCHDAATGNTPIDPAPVGFWPAPDLGPVDPDHTADTTGRVRWY